MGMGAGMSIEMAPVKAMPVDSADRSCSRSMGLVQVWLKRGCGYPLRWSWPGRT